MDGRTNGRMNEQTDGRTNELRNRQRRKYIPQPSTGDKKEKLSVPDEDDIRTQTHSGQWWV